MVQEQRNWAGNIRYRAAAIHQPETVEQVQEIVRRGRQLRALGSRHSFNRIADTTGDLISLDRLEPAIEFDHDRRTVTVGGGISYGRLCRQLDQAGYALPNLASLPHISVAGACATGTHGSGDHIGGLATAVSALEIVTATGELLHLSRAEDGDRFKGAVVALGALGVVTSVTLDLEPAFAMRQTLYQNLPMSPLAAHFDAITASAYSVSLFTIWQNEQFDQVWLKSRVEPADVFEPAPTFFGATPATRELHPIGHLSADSCTPQMGVPGPWFERLPHFRMEFTPSAGEEIHSEFFVPRHHAVAAILSVERLRDRLTPLLLISEVRTIAADELWLSPCYGRESVTIHFTWKPEWPAVKRVLPLLEEQLAPFDARPHWGKQFTMPPRRLASLYGRLPDFRRLLQELDPAGKFRNAFLERHIFGRE